MVSGLMEEPLDSFVPPSGLAGRLHASEGSTFHFATRLKLAQALTGEPAPPRADSGGNAFAGACAKNQKRATSFAIEPVCYLQDLFTAEASRRKGVGRADRGSLSAGKALRLRTRLLAHAGDQPHRQSALRQGCRAFGVHQVSETVLTPCG